MFYRCTKCLVPNTRPRTTFINGICSACSFKKKKKKIDWDKRWSDLEKICNKFRSKTGDHDVIVPAGGGKDSSYVAWVLKNELKMNPLCVCATPPLLTKLGRDNLDNFINSGFDVLEVNPNRILTKKLSLSSMKKYGIPQQEWLMRILTIPINISSKFKIPFIMYGEEAESEYGGITEYEDKARFNKNIIYEAYFSGITISDLIDFKKNKKYLSLYKLPEKKDYEKLYPTHWSYFEQWDEVKHLKIAEKYCGLIRSKKNTHGADNNFSHLDQEMYILHMYMAYVKFGFSRATTDTSIDIREGNISRSDAIKLVKKLDHKEPIEYYSKFANYFGITKKTLIKIIESHRNKKIFENNNNKWVLKDDI
jgi:N-acetyl sugar amidotransferase